MISLDEITDQVAKYNLETQEVQERLIVAQAQKPVTLYDKIEEIVAGLRTCSPLLQRQIDLAHSHNKKFKAEHWPGIGNSNFQKLKAKGAVSNKLTLGSLIGRGGAREYTLDIYKKRSNNFQIDETIQITVLNYGSHEEILVQIKGRFRPKMKVQNLPKIITDAYSQSTKKEIYLNKGRKRENRRLKSILALPYIIGAVPELIVSGAKNLAAQLKEEEQNYLSLHEATEEIHIPDFEEVEAQLLGGAYKALPPKRV